ncbi:acyl carrier protein [Acetivibrio mesophilus]|uniref:Acyl carrier protein n=1 Tax=Acetivibrio mesophilus TaxID=2487273 RepID=A0A4Q0I2Q0_9FIRM|nr:acyl carrier protein [Acetivibrio mesophilus]ODM27035.1 hypothetical protein A7W90_12905 [Clostridium sp. Bc-iso-3]RXE58520.1 acyl carrier protein [Acetivibrio mesophilus]HHV28801.1 acyl carrier protein [Clostridium sp.]
MNELSIKSKVLEILKENSEVDPGNITEVSRIRTDLGIDSIKLVDVVMSIEDVFGVDVDIASLTPENFSNAQRITQYIIKKMENTAKEVG